MKTAKRILLLILLAVSFQGRPAQAQDAAMRRLGEGQVGAGGRLLGIAPLSDGGLVVIAMQSRAGVSTLDVTLAGDGQATDSVSLPWPEPDRVTISAAGSYLHIAFGWDAPGRIYRYTWQFAAGFSREYTILIPLLPE